MDEVRQTEWKNIVDDSKYTLSAVSEYTGIADGLLRKYLTLEVTPRKKNKQKVLGIMPTLSKEKRIPFHPSYGYATPEQIKKLESMGQSPTRDLLLKQIAKQTETKGKVK